MIKGILFDKDGTLIEFNALWIQVTSNIVQHLLQKYQVSANYYEPMLAELGIKQDGTLMKNSLIASETLYDTAQVLAPYVQQDVTLLYKELDHLYFTETKKHQDTIIPIGDVQLLFKQLHNKGIRIGIVTADQYNVTTFTLQKLCIMPYIDFVATADTYAKKPAPDALHAFCQQYALTPDEVIHVGDTFVDMQFGQQAQQAVGVLSGTSDLATLQQYGPTVLPSIHDIIRHFNL